MNQLKKLVPDIVAIVLFAIISVAYFFPAITEGRILAQHDAVAGIGAGREHQEYYEKHGKATRWTNSLFSGIGRWDNIRTEGSQLIADAVFDENNPLGKEVKERVDGGFLRSASIGLSVLNYERIDGVDTVTDCELTEVSIVDIPSNRNAVKLFDKRGLIVLSLKESADGDKDLRTQLIEVLKLPATATDGEIIETVTALSGNAGPAEPDTEKALRLGYVESSQLMLLKHMARTDKSAFRKFMQDKEQAAAVDIDKELKQAVNLGKFGMPDRVYSSISANSWVSRL